MTVKTPLTWRGVRVAPSVALSFQNGTLLSSVVVRRLSANVWAFVRRNITTGMSWTRHDPPLHHWPFGSLYERLTVQLICSNSPSGPWNMLLHTASSID